MFLILMILRNVHWDPVSHFFAQLFHACADMGAQAHIGASKFVEFLSSGKGSFLCLCGWFFML
jgi:hypothetical protein